MFIKIKIEGCLELQRGQVSLKKYQIKNIEIEEYGEANKKNGKLNTAGKTNEIRVYIVTIKDQVYRKYVVFNNKNRK